MILRSDYKTPPLSLIYSVLILFLLLTACTPIHTFDVARQHDATVWTRPLDEQPLRQTLKVPEGGMSEIELALALDANLPNGGGERPVSWELRDRAGTVLGEGVVETAGFLHNTPLRLRFERLSAEQNVELLLTAPTEAGVALWMSRTDRYASGALLDNNSAQGADLYFTLRTDESVRDLGAVLEGSVERWWRGGLWLPLLLVAPGWLVGWLLHPKGMISRDGQDRPILPSVVGLSLALAPLVYLWGGWVGLRLYEPLVRSLFMAVGLLLVLLMLHEWSRTKEAWGTRWRGSVGMLGMVIVLGVVTWLLAGRALLALPGSEGLESGLVAQKLVLRGRTQVFDIFPPTAALTATLSQISGQSVTEMLLLSALVLGVATIPALFALAAEVSGEPRVAVWLLPVAWLWPGLWEAFREGNLAVLYSLALWPVAMALGLRFLRTATFAWRLGGLAVLPLAALLLIQGEWAFGGWALTLLVAMGLPFWETRHQDFLRDSSRTQSKFVASFSILGRGLLWLGGAALLLVPAWFQGSSFLPQVAWERAGIDWLIVILGLALMGRWLVRQSGFLSLLITLVVLFSLPFLVWWHSLPIEPVRLMLTQDDLNVMRWAKTGTPDEALFLINLFAYENVATPMDGGVWLPMIGERATVLQEELPFEWLQKAMEPKGLEDAELRKSLHNEGVTHLFVGSSGGPVTAEALLGQGWARVVHQSGPSYLFELLPPGP